MSTLGRPIENSLSCIETQTYADEILDLIDEEINSREAHSDRLGMIASKVYLLGKRLDQLHDLKEGHDS